MLEREGRPQAETVCRDMFLESMDTMYVEYVESGMGEPVMPDWMYDDLSMYDYGYEVCDHRPERYGYGIYVIFCDAIRP